MNGMARHVIWAATFLTMAGASALLALILPWTQYGDGPVDFLWPLNYSGLGWMRAAGIFVLAGTTSLLLSSSLLTLVQAGAIRRGASGAALTATALLALALPSWTASGWGTFPAALWWALAAAAFAGLASYNAAPVGIRSGR